MKRFLFLFCALSLLFFSCTGKSPSDVDSESLTELADEPEIDVPLPEHANIAELPKWLPGDYQRIAVYFGYGYRTEEEQAPVIAALADEFGLYKDRGLIIPLTFPEVYYTGKKVSSSFMPKELAEYDISALILVGSPEKIHYSLADLQDDEVPYPVFSIFPQDDIKGTEAGSFFVLDFFTPASDAGSVDGEQEEAIESAGFDGELSDVLIPLIKAIQKMQKHSSSDTAATFAELFSEALTQTLPGDTLTHYIAPETGIKAYNHFVLGASK